MTEDTTQDMHYATINSLVEKIAASRGAQEETPAPEAAPAVKLSRGEAALIQDTLCKHVLSPNAYRPVDRLARELIAAFGIVHEAMVVGEKLA